MVSFPPCKINLGLNITRKRDDGYHEIVTCFHPVPWTDVLEIVPADSFTFTSSGIPVPGSEEANLCVRAYELLKQQHILPPVAMYLLKIIPTGAGLGGGSSDGAYTLRMLNDLFGLGLPREELQALAATLGSDCAFFISDEPMIGRGRGDLLSEVSLNLRDKYLVIVKPELPISTARAYAHVKPSVPATDLQAIVEKYPVAEWREVLKNDFEQPLFERYPELKDIRERLYGHGAVYAAMSGSGSAVFGLFENEVSVGDDFEGMIVWAGFLP